MRRASPAHCASDGRFEAKPDGGPFSDCRCMVFPLSAIIWLYWGVGRGVLDIQDAQSELPCRQTVLARAIEKGSALSFADNARTEGQSEGYE